jgi:acetyl-CoA C-acetyltransferase
MQVRRVAVVGGNRTPFARANGPYAGVGNAELLTAAIDGLVARYGLGGERLGEVVAGAVLKHSRDYNLTRECVLGTALDPHTPAYDVQQACGTGLEAVIAVANKIALGQIDAGIAGGVDSASDAPLAVNEGLRQRLLDLNRARGLGARVRAAARINPVAAFRPEIPRNAEPRTGLSMGEHAAITAREYGITREAQDELALASHQRLCAAYESGFFDDLVTPHRGLSRDQVLRPDTSLDRLAALRPVFGLSLGDATMTAGNSSALTDGASAVLLATEEWAAARSLPVLAWFSWSQTAAVDYVHGDGLLMAPVRAVPALLSRAGLSFADIDLFEVHEAFASQVLATLVAWEAAGLGVVDRDALNVVGSSLATGHPFAATGGRIVATLAKLLSQRGGRGLISICAAGGQGVTAVLES